ncbi:hypothetical protein O181_036158 [Austropuccinia psidii MF-1]|uniref:Integrase catalytic domain-containing protein n=1 Tax=Austropuccinia psidii MF-1 TaxID=1389203 RepID=A0A9Q3D6V1_9BASI|nr:hypothetical protein [Austropuccinia psidii MF-1]
MNIKDSSSDEEVIKAKMIKLTHTNWVQWSCQFENYFVSKGMDNLLDPPSEDVKKTIKLKKSDGAALTLLWSSVSTKFEGVLLDNKSSFYNCGVRLGNRCGKNSVVVICQTLQKLVNLRYKPGSSLEKHIDDFHKFRATYLSISASSSISMNLSSSMVAAFFLQILENDKELSVLCQILYDTKPFELSAIMDRLSIEHTRQTSSHDQALLFDKNKQPESSKSKEKNKPDGPRKKPGFKDKKKGKSNNQEGEKNSTQDQNTNKRFEQIEQLLEKLQSNVQSTSVNATSESRELNRPSGLDSNTFICDEVNALIGKNQQELIYLDSGARRTVVNNLNFLEDPVPVTKRINTFSNPVKVTNEGTLLFKGIKLYPVYYVPHGPVNLLSVSQLCDHGMKLISENNLFLIKYNNLIVNTFHRQRNLFVSRLSSPVNSIYALPTACQDLHLTLGHPFDSYIKALLKDFKINGSLTHSSDFPINPQSCQGYKYVLVLINDYSHFNRIYPLTKKSQDAEYIKSYLMEIKNKLDTTPAILHTDRGGEFSSQSLVNFLPRQVISLEWVPPKSPQTNGVAERFNQTLLSKMRCLLGQSKVPVSYWDKAAAHESLLLNLLPHKHLMMKTPISVLNKNNCSIKPEVDFKRLIPFGMKVTVKISNPSLKIEPRGEVLRALTFEKYSDGLRLLNLKTGKIRVSRDYTLSAPNPSLSMKQPASVLPNVSSLRIKLRMPSSKPDEVLTPLPVSQPPNQSLNVEHSSRPAHPPATHEPAKNYK